MASPLILLHERTGQPSSCLESLVQYAKEIAKTADAAQLTEEQLLQYLWACPVVFDSGEGPTVAGCHPAQRSRIWPRDLNCWEATAHFVGWALAQGLAVEIHVFDVVMGKVRHVFPAWRPLGSSQPPEALLLQPPIVGKPNLQGLASYGMGRSRAQAEWYNQVLGGVHAVGDKVLRVFGLGELADTLAEVEGDELPDWARTNGQKAQRKAKLAEDAKAKAKRAEAKTAEAKVATAPDVDKKETPPAPPANALLVPDGRGGFWNYGPPIG